MWTNATARLLVVSPEHMGKVACVLASLAGSGAAWAQCGPAWDAAPNRTYSTIKALADCDLDGSGPLPSSMIGIARDAGAGLMPRGIALSLDDQHANSHRHHSARIAGSVFRPHAAIECGVHRLAVSGRALASQWRAARRRASGIRSVRAWQRHGSFERLRIRSVGRGRV